MSRVQFKKGDRVRLSQLGIARLVDPLRADPDAWRGMVTANPRQSYNVKVLRDGLSRNSGEYYSVRFLELDPMMAHGPLAATPEECIW